MFVDSFYENDMVYLAAWLFCLIGGCVGNLVTKHRAIILIEQISFDDIFCQNVDKHLDVSVEQFDR